jgi:hypothetical protein
MQLQKSKQKVFEENYASEKIVRNRTPTRFNDHVMNSTMHYDFAKFPLDKLTDKITKTPAKNTEDVCLGQRRSKSYYGRHCRPP